MMFVTKRQFDEAMKRQDGRLSEFERNAIDDFVRVERQIRQINSRHDQSVIEAMTNRDLIAKLEQQVKGYQVLFQRMSDTNKRIDRLLEHLDLMEKDIKPGKELVKRPKNEK